ncbi:MAG: APC family permease, partial [Clostridium sp.]
MNISHFLIGKPLMTKELKNQKYNALWGLPILSSDAISSVAYAGAAILGVLIPYAGLASYKYMLFVTIAILLLMFFLICSYKQVIDCYPSGGGAYIVAKDNFGTKASLLAASALIVDYILTVAVSSTASCDAITSAFPVLSKYRIIITIFLILFLTIGNLRGIRESSKLFGIPTYLFAISIIFMIIVGIIKVKVFHCIPKPIYTLPTFSKDITFLIFLKAFASGCTALTGIEAVSNAVPAFKEPCQKNAKHVLYFLGILVLLILGGLSYLSTLYYTMPNESQTLISQMATEIFGNNIIYYIIQFTTAVILLMAANTAFSGLPLLWSIVSKDGFAPRQLSNVGRRLSYSNGIILLSAISIFLVIIFEGNLELLLPLYAIGVFISFTISQSGMLVKWHKSKPKGWRHKAFVNAIGLLVSAFTLVVITVSKFTHGAWIICIIIPILVFGMLRIKKYYDYAYNQLKINAGENIKEYANVPHKNHTVLLIDSLNKSF